MVIVHYPAKFFADRPNNLCGDMVIFRFFNLAVLIFNNSNL